MATIDLSGTAVVAPQSAGTGLSTSSNDVIDAVASALLASHSGGEYVGAGLDFQNIDTGANETDISAGACFVADTASTTAGQRGASGRPRLQSTAASGYDTELPSGTEMPYLVLLPTAQTNVSLDAGAVNDIYLSVDPTNQNSVTLHYGSTISAPSDPHLQLGTVDTSSGATTRPNDKKNLDEFGSGTATDGYVPAATGSGGVSWEPQSGSGGSVDGQHITPASVNREVYASSFSGADLAAKVDNALSYLKTNVGGRGRVRVTPKSDATRWTWGSDLTIDPKNDYDSGVDIDIDNSVEIEYPGSGWALTVDTQGDFEKADPAAFTLSGGQWISTGDALGCIRVRDLNQSIIDPFRIDFDSGTNETTGIKFINRDRWSEMNKTMLSGGSIRADIGIHYLGASFNTNSTVNGTDSFQGNYLGPAQFDVDVTGIRCQGNMQYCLFDNPQIFLFGDGAIGIELDGGSNRMWGFTIAGGKTEEHASNTVSFHLGPGYDGFNHGPTLVGGWYQHPTTMLTADGAASNTWVCHTLYDRNTYNIIFYTPSGDVRAEYYPGGGEMSLSVDELGTQRTAYTPVDVTTLSASQGWVAYNDGTTGTEGLASYDGTNWTSLVDGSTI